MFSFFYVLLIVFIFSIFPFFHFSAVVRFRVAAFVYLLISRLARLVGACLVAKHHPSDAAEEASLSRVPHSRTDHASCEMIAQKRKRLDDFQHTLGSLRRRTSSRKGGVDVAHPIATVHAASKGLFVLRCDTAGVAKGLGQFHRRCVLLCMRPSSVWKCCASLAGMCFTILLVGLKAAFREQPCWRGPIVGVTQMF